jgi:hypothetical protein
MPQTKRVSAFPTFRFQRSTQKPDLDPDSRCVAGDERRSHYRSEGARRGQRCGRGLDLFFAPFELLRILFNHGFKARDVLNARFQFQPILFD